MKKVLARCGLAAALISLLAASTCESDATIASRNLSTAADNFEIVRKIVFYNVWTDEEVAVVEGRCSLDVGADRLSVTCKEAQGAYKKHYLGRSQNLSFFAIQMADANVSTFHTRIIWKPQSIVPDIDLSGSMEELISDPD